MSDESKRRQGAERLFGALSGVDEKYLTACEGARNKKGSSKGRIMMFAQKYGKLAAVLGIAVIGLGLLGLQSADFTLFEGADMSAKSLQNESSIMSGGTDGKPETDRVCEEAELTVADTSEQNNAGQPPDMEDGAGQLQDSKEDVGANIQNEPSSPVDKYKEDQVDREGSSVKDSAFTLAQAGETAVVGKYLPTVLPSEGSTAWVTAETTAGQESVSLCWAYPDGAGSFLWTVHNLGAEKPDRNESDRNVTDGNKSEWNEKIPAGQPVLEGADMTRDDMEAQIADAILPDGGITGAVLCVCYHSNGNYVLIVFQGNCDTDTLWEMFCSVGGN